MAAIPGSAPILGSGAFTPAPIYAPTGTIGGSSPILPSDSFSKQPIGPIADTPLARQGELGGQTPMDNDTMKRMMDKKPIKEQDPPCTTCKKKKEEEEEKKKKEAAEKAEAEKAEAARKAAAETKKDPPRPYQLFSKNIQTEGTYESVTVANMTGDSTTYTRVVDQNGKVFHYQTNSTGMQGPGAGISTGTWASNGTADDYWLGKGQSIGKGIGEYGWNDAGYNMGLSGSLLPKKWNVLDWSATQGDTTRAPFLDRMFGGPQNY